MDDVAGEAAEAQGEFYAKEQQSAHEGQKRADEEEGAAEFAEGIHATEFKREMRGSQRAANNYLWRGKELMD
jgi:hypothetical protein